MSRPDRFISHANEIALRTDIDRVKRNLETLAKDSDLSSYDLTKLQKDEFKMSHTYEDAWVTAVNKPEVKGGNADYNAALRSYTFEYPSLYRIFNEKTREYRGNIHSYHFRSYFTYLKLAIETTASNQPGRPQYLYRGCSGKFGANPGDVIMFQHFVSTTEEKSTAMGFGYGGTLFEIQGEIKGSVSLKKYSDFPGEEEWLLWPYETYKIITISNMSNNTRKIVLEPTSASSEWCSVM